MFLRGVDRVESTFLSRASAFLGGGLPTYGLVEVLGEADSGKSTFALRLGLSVGRVVYVGLDGTPPSTVNEDSFATWNLPYVRSDQWGLLFESFDVVVVDSSASLLPEKDGDRYFLLRELLAQMMVHAKTHGSLCIMVSQLRDGKGTLNWGRRVVGDCAFYVRGYRPNYGYCVDVRNRKGETKRYRLEGT